MQLITLTERELDLLLGEPAEVVKMYLCLRRRMDFKTGLVGAVSGVSWWALREDMFVEHAQGRSRDSSGAPTEKMVRSKVERLASIGLVESRTSYRRLVFLLPLAHKATVRLKKVGQTYGRQAGQETDDEQSIAVTAPDECYSQEVGQIESAEVGHTSGIRLTPISENKQQHTDCLVDNSVALRFEEIAEWLRVAEKRRGKIVAIAESDKHVKSWVCRGVDAETLSAAHALAVSDRERQRNPAPIGVKFLDIFIGRVLVHRKPWYATATGIERKAGEFGINRTPDEAWPYFRLRVLAAAGITDEEVRRWKE